MTLPYPEVPIGQVAKPVSRPEVPLPGSSYRLIGVRLWGQGAYERETIDGSQTKYATLSRVEAGDIVVNKIWARNGSVSVVTDDLEGCYGSNEFPTFGPVRDLLDPLWFYWITKTKGFWEQCDEKSRGTSGQNRIRPERFLEIVIPLPPLAEQRRIVARIEELAAKVEEARGLRRDAIEQAELLMASEEMRIWPDEVLSGARRLQDITTYLSRGRQSAQGESDHFLIKTQHVQMASYVPTLMTLAPHVAAKVSPEAVAMDGDILIACSAAGCLGRVAQYVDTGRTASTDTHVAIARPDNQSVLPEYLYAYLKGAQGQRQLRSRERGDWTREKIGFRLTELNLADLRNVPVPVPSMQAQEAIVQYVTRIENQVNEMKSAQAATAAELDALLPAILDKAFRGEL